MEWIKNPKNQPIVAGILIAVIVAVGIFYYFMFIKAPSADQGASAEATAPAAPGADGTAPAPSPDPNAGAAPGAPSGAPAAPTATPTAAPAGAPAAAPAGAAGAVGTTAAAPTAAKGTQVASVTPMETWRGDPFLPIGYKARKKLIRVTAPIRDFPFITLPGVSVATKVKREKPEIQQPPRRMAGILLNDRVYAIIESNGGSEVVQPGDYLKDRLAMVQKIEPDKVVLKTVDEKPRYITVRMAASAHTNTPANSVPGGSPGGAMVPSMRPGAPVAPGIGPPP